MAGAISITNGFLYLAWHNSPGVGIIEALAGLSISGGVLSLIAGLVFSYGVHRFVPKSPKSDEEKGMPASHKNGFYDKCSGLSAVMILLFFLENFVVAVINFWSFLPDNCFAALYFGTIVLPTVRPRL